MKYDEFNGKNIEELKNEAYETLNLDENNCLITTIENKGSLFKGSTYTIKVYRIEEVAEYIKSFLKELLNNMSIEEVSFEIKIRENKINIKMFSSNNNILIGKNGQTLTSLQAIIKQHIYNQIGTYPYILLDVENYKEKREIKLEKLAKQIAREVKKTHQQVELDNMNSYERRIIHNILSEFKGVSTQSVGVEPNRHIIVKPKED